MLDEEPTHFNSASQGSSAVVAQVERYPFYPVGFQAFDLFGEVFGAFTAVLVLEIDIEFRDVDHRVFATVFLDHRRADERVLYFHYVAHQRDFFDRSVGFLQFQAYGRAFFTPYQVYCIVQTHTDDAYVFVVALGDFQYLVAYGQLAAFSSRTSRYDAGNGDISVFLLEYGSYPFELSGDAGVEILFLARGHVLRMGIVISGKCVEVHREPIFGVEFGDAFEVIPVIFQYRFTGFLFDFGLFFRYISAVFGGFVLFDFQVGIHAGKDVVF